MHINDDGSSSAVHDDYTEVTAVPYDVPVIGYKNRTVNTLRLWNAEANQDFSDYASLTNDEIKERQEYRNKVNKITEFLYPMIAPMRASASVWFRSTSLYLLVYRVLYVISCVPMMMLAPLQTKYASRLTIPIQQ